MKSTLDLFCLKLAKLGSGSIPMSNKRLSETLSEADQPEGPTLPNTRMWGRTDAASHPPLKHPFNSELVIARLPTLGMCRTIKVRVLCSRLK